MLEVELRDLEPRRLPARGLGLARSLPLEAIPLYQKQARESRTRRASATSARSRKLELLTLLLQTSLN